MFWWNIKSGKIINQISKVSDVNIKGVHDLSLSVCPQALLSALNSLLNPEVTNIQSVPK